MDYYSNEIFDPNHINTQNKILISNYDLDSEVIIYIRAIRPMIKKRHKRKSKTGNCRILETGFFILVSTPKHSLCRSHKF